MEQSFEHIELFEAYHSKTLTGKELLEFEARLSYDQEFREEFNRFQKLEEGIKQHFRGELKNKLNQVDKELKNDVISISPPKKAKKLCWISAVAASLIIGIFLFNFYYSENNHSQLAQQYWPIEEGLPVKMSTKGIYDDAMNAFKQGQWQEAEDLLLTINSDTAHYFLGVINYQQKDYKTTVEYFNKIYSESYWYNESQFRLALVLLLNKDLDKAKSILEELINQETYFSEKSKKILLKIETK
jgi:TolA-binding protein